MYVNLGIRLNTFHSHASIMKKVKTILISLLVINAIYIFSRVYNNLDYLSLYKNVRAESHSACEPFHNTADVVAMRRGRNNGNWSYTRQLDTADNDSMKHSEVDNVKWTHTGQLKEANGESMKSDKDDKYNWSNIGQVKKAGDLSIKLDINDKYNWSYSGQFNKEYAHFAPAMNMTEYTRYMDLITVFKGALEAFNITYMLSMGSVLGAYMHHGFIPWDEDFDCRVNVSQTHILKKALTDISGYTLLSPPHYFWKFYSNNFAKSGHSEWNWPFIDIRFYADNETHLSDVPCKNQPNYFDPRSEILPLENGIFENMIFPVPRNMEAYLHRRYKMHGQCLTHHWNHKTNRRMGKSSRMPCHKLFGVYPLVHQFQLGNSSFEELRLGNKVLYTVDRTSMKLLKPKILW